MVSGGPGGGFGGPGGGFHGRSEGSGKPLLRLTRKQTTTRTTKTTTRTTTKQSSQVFFSACSFQQTEDRGQRTEDTQTHRHTHTIREQVLKS